MMHGPMNVRSDFSLCHHVKNGSETHIITNPFGLETSFPMSKEAVV